MRTILTIGLMACLIGCGNQPEPDHTASDAQPGDSTVDKAMDLAQSFIIVDGHIDVPYRLQNEEADISQRTEGGDFDYVRAKAGGLNAPFMSIYTPASLQDKPDANKLLADELIDRVEGFATQWPDKFAIARSPADIRAQFEQGLISLPLGMENGAPIGNDLANLRHFYDRGIRYITLTHSEDNQICDSSYADTRTWGGLSPFGRDVVKEMNRLGIMVDISHISDDTFYQVMDVTEVPVIASHSSCRHFVPGFERNMSDDMIKKLAENGGVIMINFGSSFISEAYRKASDDAREQVAAWATEQGLERRDPKVREYYRNYMRDNVPYADIKDVFDHFQHVIELVGVDHVGFGSDYDGVGDSLPTGLKDVAAYPALIRMFLDHGYSEADIEKICSGNVLRVWEAVEAFATVQNTE